MRDAPVKLFKQQFVLLRLACLSGIFSNCTLLSIWKLSLVEQLMVIKGFALTIAFIFEASPMQKSVSLNHLDFLFGLSILSSADGYICHKCNILSLFTHI